MDLVCSFTCPADFEARLAAAKRQAQNKGITLEGDASRGRFSGKGVAGSYAVTEGALVVTVHERPWYATEDRVRQELEQLLA